MDQDSGTSEVAVFMIRELEWQKASCWEMWDLVDLHLLHKERSTNTLFKVAEPERCRGPPVPCSHWSLSISSGWNSAQMKTGLKHIQFVSNLATCYWRWTYLFVASKERVQRQLHKSRPAALWPRKPHSSTSANVDWAITQAQLQIRHWGCLQPWQQDLGSLHSASSGLLQVMHRSRKRTEKRAS